MANHFDAPPTLMGDEQSQLTAMYRYLMQMSDQLNEAMNNITLANFAPEAQKQLTQAAGGSGESKEVQDAKRTLRSMIIKSAEIVRNEMTEISTELQQQYTAVSQQFGTLDQKLSLAIQANADGIRQNYEYIEKLEGRTDETNNYIIHTSNYIFSGQIGTNEVTMEPVYGIAIGEGITQYDSEGNPHINGNAKVATFTKERLSFWQGTAEMAYFSDKTLYVTDASILKTLRMGNYYWKIEPDGSMGLTATARAEE